MDTSLSPLVNIEEKIALADSRIIAKKLGIQHRSFFKMILEYQEEIERDFGIVRFEIAVGKRPQGGGNPQKYAMLTEDQTFAYLAYSQNTEQARYCKRQFVKAFSTARDMLHTYRFAPNADLTGLTDRNIRKVGIVAQIADTAPPERTELFQQFIYEVENSTEEDSWDKKRIPTKNKKKSPLLLPQ